MPQTNGPQAKNDAAAGQAGKTVLIDVMDNDLGGAAKHLVSVNQVQPTLAATTATSALGATVSIVGDQISYSATGANFQSLSLGQKVVDTFTYTIQMGNGVTSTATVSVTVTGTNHAPTVSGAVVGVATEDGLIVRLNALQNAADQDAGTVLQVTGLPTTLPAGVTYDAATHSFALDPTHAAYQSLAAGETKTVVVSYAVSDGAVATPATASWTITGVNDAALISGTHAGAVTEDLATQHAAAGLLTVSDLDHDQAKFATPASLAGTYGAFTLDAATGQWGYVLDDSKVAVQALAAGETTTDTLHVTSLDGTAGQDIVITITGANDTATIAGSAAGNVTEDVAAQHAAAGVLTVADVDHGEAKFAAPASLAGTYGAFSFDAVTGQWGYVLDDSKVQALAAGETTTDTLHVTSLDGTAGQDIVVTITGTNDAATIAGSAAGAVAEDLAAQHAAAGQLTVSDVDHGEAKFATPASLAGTYGAFSFDAASGQWDYDLDDSKVQALAAGETTSDTLHVTSLDGTAAQDIVVTITGTNDAATIAGTAAGAVAEDLAAQHAAAGQLTVSDVDHGEAKFATPASLAGTYGAFSLDAATGQWGYVLDDSKVQALAAGETTSDTLHVTSLDGTAGQDVVVTITGTNDAATISGSAAGAVAEDTAAQHTAAGLLTVSDVDHGEAKFAAPASLTGTYGAFSFDAASGQWGYTLDDSKVQVLAAGETTTDTLHVTSLDGTAGQDIVVTIAGTNDAATIAGSAAGAVTEDLATRHTAAGFLTVSDVDHGEAKFAAPASLAGTYGAFSFDAASGQWGYTLDDSKVQTLAAGETTTDTLHVTSLDGTAGQDIVVTITGTNDVATISGSAAGAVTEDVAARHAVYGGLTVSDVDHGEAKFAAPASLAGTYGAFGFDAASGQWVYVLDDSKVQALAAGETTTDTLHVTSFDGTAGQDIVVTITGTNDAPSISGTAAGAVTEDSATQHTAAGVLTVSDVDHGEARFATPASLAGTSGAFSFDAATGQWGYILDDSKVQALAAGETTTDTLHVTSLDGTAGQDIVVTITGTNDVATISGSAAGAVTEDSATQHTAAGVLTVTDLDHDQAKFATPASLAGTYGSFTFNAQTGQWGYTLDDAKAQVLGGGETTTDTLHVASLDGTAGQDIVVTISGANDAAQLSGTFSGTVNGLPGQTTAAGAVAVTDIDHGEAHLATPSSLAGSYGAYTLDTATGAWTYTLDNNNAAVQALAPAHTLTDHLTIRSVDGTATQDLAVTINGVGPAVNNAAADQVVSVGQVGAGVRYEFQLNSDEFADVTGSYTLSAKLANGQPLPTGLTFDPTTRTFLWASSNAAPPPYDITVTATDGTHTASDTFTLKFAVMQSVFAGDMTGTTVVGTSAANLVEGDGYTFDPRSSHAALSDLQTATASAYLTTPTTTIPDATAVNGLTNHPLTSPTFVGPALPSQGALTVTASDDGSQQLDLTSIFGASGLNFFGKLFTTGFLNQNGVLSFNTAVSSYSPQAFPVAGLPPFIAAFWADVDTRSTLTAAETQAGFTNKIYYNLDSANGTLTATWDGVGDYNLHTDKLNSFQLQVIAKGDQGDFDVIFRYQSINWLIGDASGGAYPAVGFQDGAGNNYNLPGTLTAQMGNLETATNTTPAMAGTLVFHFDHTTMAGAADTLTGGLGDDILMGGAGDDRFVFHLGDGHDIIRDFVPGPTGGHDTIQLLGYGSSLDTFAEVMGKAAQVGGNVVITIDASNSITLEGVTLNQLNAQDFLFA